MKTLLLCSIVFLSAVSAMAQNRPADDFVLIKGGTFTMGSPAQD
jgi:formylglycine-generating enzyme required for sulfatase activity